MEGSKPIETVTIGMEGSNPIETVTKRIEHTQKNIRKIVEWSNNAAKYISDCSEHIYEIDDWSMDANIRINDMNKKIDYLINENIKLKEFISKLQPDGKRKRKYEPEEEQNINIEKVKKEVNYEHSLAITMARVKPWKKGMSKYRGITFLNNKFWYVHPVFKSPKKHFNLLEEAEKYYESLMTEYNISFDKFLRPGYNPEEKEEVNYFYEDTGSVIEEDQTLG
jgi:hypothetical protein